MDEEMFVKRKRFSDICTIGELSVSGQFQCYTLEDTVRSNGVKVDGKTAIPSGTYEVIIDFSIRFQRPMPHILNVPGFTGIRIHPGNTDKDTEGCLLLGKLFDPNTPDFIGESQVAFDDFLPKLEAALANGKVYISIG